VAALLALLNPAVAARAPDAAVMAAVVVAFYGVAGLGAGLVLAIPAVIFRRAAGRLAERGFGVAAGTGLVLLAAGVLFRDNRAMYLLCIPPPCGAALRSYSFLLFGGGALALVALAAWGSRVARGVGKFLPAVLAPALFLAFPLAARTVRPPAPPAPPLYTRADTGLKVYLVGIDALDPRLVASLAEAGRVPNLARMTAGGASGELETLPPGLSPVIWTSVATGRYPRDHGVADYEYFKIRGVDTPLWVFPSRTFLTLLTRVKLASLASYSGADRRGPALWNITSGAGVNTAVAGWLLSTPAEKVAGDMLTDYYDAGYEEEGGAARVAYPAALAPEYVKYYHRPEGIGREAAARLLPPGVPPFYGRHFLKAYAAGRTQEDISLQLLKRDAPTFAASYFAPVDPLQHLYWGFRPEVALGRPEEVRKWGGVVDRAYEWADAYVGEVLALADARTVVVVVSDHGVKTAGPARRWYYRLWQRREVTGIHDVAPPPSGFVALAGGPVRKGVALRGASVMDVAPNVLYLLGLPVADDMPGRIWWEAYEPAFAAKFPRRRIPTYAGLPVERPGAPAAPAGVEDERLKALKALGYVK